MYSLTLFKSIFDNKTDKRVDCEDWSKFKGLLYKLSEKPLKGKRDAVLISPAVYKPDTTRANKNVVCWSKWAAVDVDDHDFKGNLENELHSRIGSWTYICYSTASSRISHPKFRIVFDLDRNVESSEIRHFWFALNTELESVGDKQCKDLSRMYYIPATYSEANNFIFDNSGEPISVSGLLAKHPYVEKSNSASFIDRLPEDLQNKIISFRKEKMNNTSISWSGYRDCPFVNKGLIKEYTEIAFTDNSGRYALIYKIMTSIAMSAIKHKYPISANEIEQLIRELDRETSRRYERRNLYMEADRAIEYAYRNV